MAAPVGNEFWKLRSSHGPHPTFEKPEDLWNACVEYFEWVQANPLMEERLVSYQGESVREPVAKMRAMTVAGLCTFLDISRRTWDAYEEREEFKETVERVNMIIWAQKFEGAAADLLNGNIIARELGLADRKQVEVDEPAARDPRKVDPYRRIVAHGYGLLLAIRDGMEQQPENDRISEAARIALESCVQELKKRRGVAAETAEQRQTSSAPKPAYQVGRPATHSPAPSPPPTPPRPPRGPDPPGEVWTTTESDDEMRW